MKRLLIAIALIVLLGTCATLDTKDSSSDLSLDAWASQSPEFLDKMSALMTDVELSLTSGNPSYAALTCRDSSDALMDIWIEMPTAPDEELNTLIDMAITTTMDAYDACALYDFDLAADYLGESVTLWNDATDLVTDLQENQI